MARDPHKAVDFAPAWLNFNNSNKKKPEKTSGTHSSSLAPTFSLSSPLKISQDSPLPFRTNSLGLRSGGSPSRSSNTSFRNHHSPSSRIAVRHHSVDFSPSYLDTKNGYSSPGREFKSHARPLAFSPTLASSKSSSLTWTKNGPTPLHHTSGGGDTSPRLDTEFPSLSDTDSSEQKSKVSPKQSSSATVVNMWQKPLVLKNKQPQQVNDQMENTKSLLTSSIYKTLVPKTSASHKQPYRRTMSVPLALPSKSTNPSVEGLTNGSKRDVARDGNANQPTAPKYLTGNTSNLRLAKSELQTSVVSGHKKHKKSKNDFLRTLRQTENEDESACDINFLRKVEESEPLPAPFSGTETSKLSDGINTDSEDSLMADTILSSSLEAEHRLLKEMGWKYSDDQAMEEEPPLTEDEIREFHVRCNGILPTITLHRDKVLENAFSGWKFSGIRKQSADADYENNNRSTFIQKQENRLCSSEDLEEFSSDDNEF